MAEDYSSKVKYDLDSGKLQKVLEAYEVMRQFYKDKGIVPEV